MGVKYLCVLLTLLCSIWGGCATVQSGGTPSFALDVPPAFHHAMEERRFKVGDHFFEDPPSVERYLAPTSRMAGAWGAQRYPDRRDHAWAVEVRRATAEKVGKILDARANAVDGYAAGSKVDETQSYMFARFTRMNFKWGTGFSYLTQYTQDTGVYVPHNGHLTYEVWAVTHDRRFVVYATFVLTHPELATWGPEVRDADSMEGLKKDRDYLRVESCPGSKFRPDLEAVNAMLDSLRVEG